MATSSTLPEPPAQLKAIQSYMKIAADIERVDPVVAYWLRLYSTETALSIDRDSPESKSFLGALILWLEEFKQSHKADEKVSNQTVGQAHVENFVLALFQKADTLDREGTANKNTVKMFYIAAILFEGLAVFGPLSEDMITKAKYSKFKAAYIQKCLKAGQVPKPGPVEGSDLDDPSYGPPAPPGDGGGAGQEPPKTVKASDGSPTAAMPTDPFILTPSTRPPVPPSPPNQANQSPLPTGYSEPPPQSLAMPAAKPRPADSSLNSSSSSSSTPSALNATKFHATNGAPLNATDIIKGQKYCKFANSALQYDDIPTAVKNLEKALKLLKTGQQPE